jgi:hypothetical protein
MTVDKSPARDHRGHFTRTLDTVERDARVAELRAQQFTFAEIADQVGFSDASGARKAYERAVAAIIEPAAAEARAVESLKLDAIERRAWAMVNAVATDDDGNPLPLKDGELRLAAGNQLLRVAQRRAALNGWDAPTRLESTVTSHTYVDDEVLALLEEDSATHQDDGGDPCPKDEPDPE